MGGVGIVAIARKEHDYLQEFIQYHRMVGVSAFYIYDNGLEDDEPLAVTLADEADCRVVPFPGDVMQLEAYSHFIAAVMPAAKEEWFAFIDVDEFIVPAKHASIPAFLEEYGHLGAIGLNWRMFGADGHVRKPDGWTTQNYVRSTFHKLIKTLAHRSMLAAPVTDIHNLGSTCRRLDGTLIGEPFSEVDNTDVIRLNHYFCKSWSEFLAKVDRGRADVTEKRDLVQHIPYLLGVDGTRDTALLDLVGKAALEHDAARQFSELASLVDPATVAAALRCVEHNEKHAGCAAKSRAAFEIIEGSVNEAQVKFLTKTLRVHDGIRRVLEIGFNGGMSASAMLGARADVKLVSVDIGEWGYVGQAKRIVDQCYPRRHTLVLGDSTEVVPQLPRNELFDMAFIDGGHNTPVPQQDIDHVLPLLRAGGMVVVDDYCESYGTQGVIEAWDAAVAAGKIRQAEVFSDGDRGWVVGYKA